MSSAPRKGSLTTTATLAMTVLALWLGWQVVREVAAVRLPGSQALRLSPTSPEVLGKAAEEELRADRISNADALARDSLQRAPFSVRALRVLGLAEAKADSASARELVTLAGNWSLRDDPAHAWLMQNGLERGDYASAFAHADTLVRRRRDLYPEIFRLFGLAATADPRAAGQLVTLLGRRPPWRADYLEQLSRTDEGLALSANLAVALQKGPAPYNESEIGQLYGSLLSKRLIGAMEMVRNQTRRPALSDLIVDGGFSGDNPVPPFAWRLIPNSGVSAEFLEDELGGDQALRVEMNGRASDPIVEQFLLLKPGLHELRGNARTEPGPSSAKLRLQVICYESGGALTNLTWSQSPNPGWRTFRQAFTVPDTGCTAQWIRMVPERAERRSHLAVWFDGLSISRIQAS